MKQNEDSLLREKLKEYFGFSSFKGNQEAVIRNVLSGKDTFVLMPTGGGKSLCYQLPALLMDGVAIVISPLIALMKNQVDAMRTYSNDAGIAHFLNSSLNKSAIAQVRNDVLEGRTKLLYFAPESLTKEDNVAFLRKVKVSFYAIDEAHCISEWGHDFRPEYRRIRPIINEIGTAPLIALTATATPKVQMDIQKNLGMNDASVFKSSFNRPNLYYEIRPKRNVDHDIIRFIKQNEGKSGIIIRIKPGTKGEQCHIPVIISKSGVTEMVYNDFYIGEGSDVLIVAGCGIDNCGSQDSQHDGLHRFFVEKNAHVRYVEKHYGSGDGTGKRLLNPGTEVHLAQGSSMEMEMVQIRGVDSTIRTTTAELEAGARLVVRERLMTHGDQKAESIYVVTMKGAGSSADVVSRSVAKDNSWQKFDSRLVGQAACSGHTECDAIIMDHAKILAVPQLEADDLDAALIHEAAIGKIAGEQIIKLMTLGLTEQEAEEQIISGFLK